MVQKGLNSYTGPPQLRFSFVEGAPFVDKLDPWRPCFHLVAFSQA